MNRRHVTRFVVAGLLIGLSATGAAAALAASQPSNDGSTDPAASSLNRAQILTIARAAAASAGDPAPTLIQHVEGTRAQLNLAASGAIVPGDEASVLIVAFGRFVATNAPVPAGAATPQGTILTAVVNTSTGQQTDFGIQDTVPRLSGLGPVVTDFDASATAAARTKHGVLRGAIYRAGGPKPDPSSRAAKEAGVATVFSLGGRKIARQNVRAGHDFRFTLKPGVYRVVAGKSLHPRGGCGATRVRVRAGRAVRASVRTGCSTP